MVTAGNKEVLPRSVSVNDLVFGTIEDCTVDRQHGCNAQYFIRTLVPTTTITDTADFFNI